MGLTRLAIARPLAILMFILGVVLMGLVAYGRLGVERLPRIEIPFVSVDVSYPGAAPEDIETSILQPLEDALAGVSGAETIRSSARSGSGSVDIQLAEGTNPDQALADVQRRVAAVQPRFPKDANDPRIGKFDPSASPIMNLALTGGNQEELYQLASDVIQPKLESLAGVAQVDVSGGLQREIQVQLDLMSLAGYGVSVDQINTALQRENISAPAGNLAQGRSSLSVRSFGLFQKPEELGSLIVTTAKDGTPVYLRNVAAIKDTYRQRTNYLRFNGDESVGLSVYKQSDANTLSVAEAVRSSLSSLQQALPPGSQLVVSNDSSRFVRRSLDAVQLDLGLAAFLTALVLMLFLHAWRNTLIVLLSIPTSLIATFLVMYALGFTLNLMTLMALAMTIGILVDDSIVVLENIHRHLRLGESPFQAAFHGRSEIGLAAMAITFTDIVVYLPVAFMQGNVGQLFRQYGLSIATATVFSLLISFTLTPMLASRWLKERDNTQGKGPLERFARWWEAGFDRVAGRYGLIQGWGLNHRPVVLGVAALAFGASLSVIPLKLVGSEYAPQEDDNLFMASLQLPVGTSLGAANEAALQFESLVQQIPEVRNVFTRVSGGGGFGGSNANISVELIEKSQRSRSLDQILAQVRSLSSSIPEANVQTSVQSPLGGGGGFTSITILGDDLATLNQIASQMTDVAQTVPGVAGVRSNFQAQQPELRFAVDRAQAAALGVSAGQVASTLRTVIQGSTVTQLQVEGQAAMNITVMGQDGQNLSPAVIGSLPVASRTGTVRLGQVAKPISAFSPVQISRVDRKRSVSLSVSTAGRTLGDVVRDLRAALATVPLPPGYRWDLRGSAQQLDLAITALTSALSMSVLLIYMLLVALYESMLYPLAIMFALPVAFVGALGGLLITGNTFNIFSMMGIIALMGLVAKNGILLVDYTNTLRGRGLARNEALVEAGKVRLRPIVMTTATVVAAMLPLAFKFEAGAESRAPIAVVVIGGVLSSTLLTLVLVPVMYTVLDDLQTRLRIPATFRWPWHRQVTGAQEPVSGILVTAAVADGGAETDG